MSILSVDTEIPLQPPYRRWRDLIIPGNLAIAEAEIPHRAKRCFGVMPKLHDNAPARSPFI